MLRIRAVARPALNAARPLATVRRASSSTRLLARPALYPPLVIPKAMALADDEYTQEKDSQECGFVAGQQIVNFHSKEGFVGKPHGKHWALQSGRFNEFSEEINARKFRLDSADVNQMIKWFVREYGMEKLISFSLAGVPINEVLRIMVALRKSNLPGFQVLVSSQQHAMAIHEPTVPGSFLTTGAPSGAETYAPTSPLLHGELIGSKLLSLNGNKKLALKIAPSYGYVSADAIDQAVKRGPFIPEFEQFLRWIA